MIVGEAPGRVSAYAGRICLVLAVFIAGVASVHGADSGTQEQIYRSLQIEYKSPLLAARGDARITHGEFDARMQAVPEADRPGVISDPERIARLMQDMLTTQAVASDAIERGALDDPLVQAELYRVVAVRLADIQRTHVMESAELGDYTQQARELYLAEKERFKTQPTVSFTHLLIRNAGEESAESTVAELLQRVEQGESLETLAIEHSRDPSVKQNRGRFEDSPLERLEAKFRDGIGKIAEGEVGIVESAYGWHLVRVDEREPARQQTFEEITDKLRSQAREQHLTEVWERYLRELNAPDLEIAPGGVAAILERYRSMEADHGESG